MSETPRFVAKIEHGQVVIEPHDIFIDTLATLKQPVEVLLKEVKDTRTLDQNRLYWGRVIRPYALALGESTSSLSKKEFSAYLEDIKRFASTENHIYIPD